MISAQILAQIMDFMQIMSLMGTTVIFTVYHSFM